jgi:hypothetical protein
MIVEDATGWDVEAADFGGKIVRHSHGDVTAVAYVYSSPDRVWAECTMCGADLQLEAPIQPGATAP